MYRAFNVELELEREKERIETLNRAKLNAQYALELKQQMRERKEDVNYMTPEVRLMNRRLLGKAVIGLNDLPKGYKLL